MLSPSTRAAVLEVVRRLREQTPDVHADAVAGELGLCSPPGNERTTVLEVRAALSVPNLWMWARAKSREEVAQALEEIANERC